MVSYFPEIKFNFLYYYKYADFTHSLAMCVQIYFYVNLLVFPRLKYCLSLFAWFPMYSLLIHSHTLRPFKHNKKCIILMGTSLLSPLSPSLAKLLQGCCPRSHGGGSLHISPVLSLNS